MNFSIEHIKPRKIFAALIIIFAVFYASQISFFTSRADVLAFACRSDSETPILKYAFLNDSTLLDQPALPNYHLGHTLALWLVYEIMPFGLDKTIYPAGLVSAISGAFIVGFTFLIWLNLGLSRKKSLIISVVTGLVPTIWFHSTFGEVYALQFAFILWFTYAFLRENIPLAIFTFLIANLISPVSALSFSFIFLAGWNKKVFRNAFIVGAVSLAIYVVIYILIGSNLLNLINPLGTEVEGRSFFYRILVLGFFIAINFNFFLLYLYKGFFQSFSNDKTLTYKVLLAIAPQLLLLFLGSTFFIELGSFQIPLFWGLAFFTGSFIAEANLGLKKLAMPFWGTVILTIFLWKVPDITTGIDRHDAGVWLKGKGLETKFIGDWNTSVGVILAKEEMGLKYLIKNYYDCPFPGEKDIQMTHEDSLLIIAGKKDIVRQYLAKLPIKGLQLENYNPSEKIKTGKTEKLYENKSLVIYLWTKNN